jgi:IPT/TIG domain
MPSRINVCRSGWPRLSHGASRWLAALLSVLVVLALASEAGAGTGRPKSATLTAHTAASGSGTIYAHDPDGRVTAVFNAATGSGSKITYDADGNILSVKPMAAAKLAIAQVAPPSGAPGTSVTIYGTDFGSSASAASVVIGGATATISSITPNVITTTVPSGAVGSTLSVTVSSTTANASFSVPAAPPVPAITGLSQQLANPGSALTVTGTGFSTNAAMDVASINGTKVAVSSATATALQVTLPPLAVSGQVTVTTPGGTTTSSAEVITTPPPYLAANVGFAGGLTNGTTTTITLSTANQIALALFTVGSGQRASFYVDANIPDKSAKNQYSIAIFGPGGRQVEQVSAESGQITSKPQTWSLPDDSAPGIYEIELAPVNGHTGSFQVTPATISDPTAAMKIGGPAVPIKVPTKGERPRWTFAGTSGQNVYVQWSPLCVCTAQLLSPDGSQVASDILGDQYLTATLPATGTYVFAVDDEPATGTFTARVSAIPAAVSTSTTIGGTAASLTIASPGQNGVVSFAGTAGEQVFTQASFKPTPLSAGVAIIGPDGSLIGQATYQNGSGVAVDTVTLPSTGTYQVQLSQLAKVASGKEVGYTGTAAVSVTSAPDVTGSTTVGGTPASLDIAQPGQHGVVTFPGTAGESVFTQLTMSPAESTTGTVQLIDESTGKALGSHAMTGSSATIDTNALPDTGTYEVVVDPVDETGGYTGTITVAVTSVPPPATATGSYGGPAVPVATTAPGQDASIAFTGVPAKTEIQLSVAASTFPSNQKPKGTLYEPDGIIPLCTYPLAVGVICTEKSAGAGTYTLDITHNGNGTGAISVQLAAAPSGTAAQVPSSDGSDWDQPPVAGARHPAVAYRRPVAPPGRAITWLATRLHHGPPAWSDTHLARPVEAASLTGRIVTTAGTPLPGVTVSVCGHQAKTNQAGRFDLTGLPQGMQILEMDGRTAATAHRSFGVFDVQVRLRAGANRLPFTSYFPVLDTSDEVRITEPLDRNVSLSTPAIPGLRVNLPKGIRITDADGKPVYRIGITAIPVTRTPIPMPLGEQVPVYFTVQPAGGHITHGWATVDYPNYNHAKPGATLNFWHYDVYGAGWGI